MTTKALATIEKPRKRIPGQAVESNPLVAAVVQVTESQVHDLDKEIDATTHYLAALKRMRNAFADMTGHDDSPAAVEVAVRQLPPAQVRDKGAERTTGKVTKVAGRPAVKSGSSPGRKPSGTTLKITEIFEKDINTEVPEVVRQLREAGCRNPDKSLTSLIYVVRGRVRDRKGLGPATVAPRNAVKNSLGTVTQTQQKPAAPKPAPPVVKANEKTGLGGLVADRGLLERVAEYVFKKGLVAIGDIIRDCGVDHTVANDFMQHPWFERHMDKWRLTKLGKEEGISY